MAPWKGEIQASVILEPVIGTRDVTQVKSPTEDVLGRMSPTVKMACFIPGGASTVNGNEEQVDILI